MNLTTMDQIGSRLKKLLDELRINQTRFSEIVGISKNATTSIIKNRSLPRANILQRFLADTPSVNANWLMTGNGSMFIKKQLIESLTDLVNNGDLKEIRVINSEDRPAYRNFYWQESFIKEQPVEYRNFTKVGMYRKFEMYDDSMDDEECIFPEGSMILCRRLENHFWDRLQKGDIFVLVSSDFNYKIRQLKAQTESQILLRPFNAYYDEVEVDLTTVAEIWVFLERVVKQSKYDYKLRTMDH
jgi:transcriptional regulator with XRE-family HTH domain